MERFCARCGQRGLAGATCARDGSPLVLVEGLLGRAAGNYTLVQQIGHGGMGEVFRAINPQLEAEVAIKVLHAQPTNGADGQRFLIEARAVNRVKHDGVVKIADGGYIEAGRPYLVMDLLEGRSLADVLGDQQRLPRGLRILDDVLDIVSAAHAVGIVHRDLKPANVFLTSSGRTLVLDFGVAKLLDGSGSITRTGAMVGTPSYMAPEQVHGTTVDGRTDLYAVGVMLYELLVGVRPFVAPTPFAVVQAHIQQPVPRLPPVFPPVVQQVVDLALAKEPARRFQSADEMRQHLHRAMSALAAIPELATLVDGPWPIARASRPSIPPPTAPQTSPPTLPDRPSRPSPSATATAAASPRAQRASLPPDATARETPYALSGAPDSRLAGRSPKRWWIPAAGLAVLGGIAAAIAIGTGGSSSSTSDSIATAGSSAAGPSSDPGAASSGSGAAPGSGSSSASGSGSGSASGSGSFVETLDEIATTPTPPVDAGAEPTPVDAAAVPVDAAPEPTKSAPPPTKLRTKKPSASTVKSPFPTGSATPTSKFTDAQVIARKNELNSLMGKLALGVDDVGTVIIASYQKAYNEKDYDKAMFVLEQVEGIAKSIKIDRAFIYKKYNDTKARLDKAVVDGKTVPDSVKADMASALTMYNDGNFGAANATLYRAYVALRKLK